MSHNNLSSHKVLEYLQNNLFEQEILENALLLTSQDQHALFALARERRDKAFPLKTVEVRSVIEVSNKCYQGCNYCSMGEKMAIKEYTIEEDALVEIIDCLYNIGRRVILLQSGENHDDSFIDMITRCLEGARNKYEDLTFILCLGNLKKGQYIQMRKAGADRYVLKFETSNPEIYSRAKPKDTFQNRLRCMDSILEAGYALGSGNIVGLPGQGLSDLAQDLLFIHKYNLSMNSSTVFIPAEGSFYKDCPHGNIDYTLNTMALMRIMNPHRLMPTTSSLEKLRKGGQLLGLMAGANTVTIHDGTPAELKKLFPIYSLERIAPQKRHFEIIVEQANLSLSHPA